MVAERVDVMVRFSIEEATLLDAAAERAELPRATLAHDLIVRCLREHEMVNKIEEKIEALLISDKFDEIFKQKIRAALKDAL